jgi:CTP:molybdopterin cytidylyltransferase MocA
MVVSDAPDMAGSLRIGLDRLPKRETIVVITPVDALPAEEATLGRLAKALEEDVLIVAATPTFGGRGGHPVVIRRSALDALRGGGTLHELLTNLGERRLRIEVDDPATTTDLDEPAQVIALTGKPPAFLR